jgi:hypothetical protein
MDGSRIYMPGRNHKILNDALRERGLPTTMVPGQGSQSMDSSNGMGMSDSMSMSEGGVDGGSIGPDIGLDMGLDKLNTGDSPRNEMGGEMSMSQADDMAMNDGMFDIDVDARVETPGDPLNLGSMGVDNAIDSVSDDDPDADLTLSVNGRSVGVDVVNPPDDLTSSHNTDDDDDDKDSGSIYG